MIENESETTPNELEIAIQKRNRKYQKPFKNGGGNCCRKYKNLEILNKHQFYKKYKKKLSDISNLNNCKL